MSLPNVQPVKINREQLLKHFGSFTPLNIETEEQAYNVPSAGSESSPPDRPLLNVPQLITELDTGHEILFKVSCPNDEEIWC